MFLGLEPQLHRVSKRNIQGLQQIHSPQQKRISGLNNHQLAAFMLIKLGLERNWLIDQFRILLLLIAVSQVPKNSNAFFHKHMELYGQKTD